MTNLSYLLHTIEIPRNVCPFDQNLFELHRQDREFLSIEDIYSIEWDFHFDNQSRFTRMFSSNIVLDKQSVHHRIVMFQWEIKLFDDHEILLLLLFDEYHRDIIDRFSLRRSCNQYHDIFLGKHPVYRSEKWEDFCPQIDLHAYHLRYEHVPVLFSRICISWIHR